MGPTTKSGSLRQQDRKLQSALKAGINGRAYLHGKRRTQLSIIGVGPSCDDEEGLLWLPIANQTTCFLCSRKVCIDPVLWQIFLSGIFGKNETTSEGCFPVREMILIFNSFCDEFPATNKKRLDRKFANPRCPWSIKCRILLRGTSCETFSIDCFELRQISGHATESKLTCLNYGVLMGLRLYVLLSSTSFQNFVFTTYL